MDIDDQFATLCLPFNFFFGSHRMNYFALATQLRDTNEKV